MGKNKENVLVDDVKNDAISKNFWCHYGMPLRTMIYDSLGYLKEFDGV